MLIGCCTCGGQAESMEAADASIDKLASEGRLNPALLLTMAKAYSAARETDKTKEEVKDIMAHLYFKVGIWTRRWLPIRLNELKSWAVKTGFIPGIMVESSVLQGRHQLIQVLPYRPRAGLHAWLVTLAGCLWEQ